MNIDWVDSHKTGKEELDTISVIIQTSGIWTSSQWHALRCWLEESPVFVNGYWHRYNHAYSDQECVIIMMLDFIY